MSLGTLYLVGTPIGNLEDITIRALRILKEVDLIAAEDTRLTRKLLSHYGIKKKLFSCFQHNEKARIDMFLKHLTAGRSIALVSSAGMPTISDPGSEIINACREKAVPIDIIPGVSAVTTAVALSGLGGNAFYFKGFLPRKKKLQTETIEELKQITDPVIFFESPQRIKNTIKELIALLGADCQGVLMRELTKKNQELLQGSLTAILETLGAEDLKGEISLVIKQNQQDKTAAFDNLALIPLINRLVECGLKNKEIQQLVVPLFEIPRNEVYDLILKQQKSRG